MAAVNAATLDQAERLKRKYGVKVRIQTVSKGGKELEHSGMSGAEREIIIAPNILQQMAKDPVMRNKVYGTLNPYVTQEQTSQNPLQPLVGGKGLSHSLIVHKDGSVALWSAAASPREAETGKHSDVENRNEQAEESRTAAERRHAWEVALPILSKNLLSAAEASLQGQEPAANPVDGVAAHDWLHQLQLVRARRSNKLL
nr:DUF6033 family protein [Paenibacillus sonchi]